MKDSFKITTLEAMRAVADNRRVELLRELVERAQTAAELADALGQDKSKLYYHLGELEKHGLIEVVETRQKRNFIEKTYRAVARHYGLDDALLTGEGSVEVVLRTTTSILDAARNDLARLVDSQQIDATHANRIAQSYLRVDLDGERREAFLERLGELVREFAPNEGDESEDPYVFAFVSYPTPR